MNSFSAMIRAIDYEISRQVVLHREGQSDQIVQETRLWDEASQVYSMLYCFSLHLLYALLVLYTHKHCLFY